MKREKDVEKKAMKWIQTENSCCFTPCQQVRSPRGGQGDRHSQKKNREEDRKKL